MGVLEEGKSNGVSASICALCGGRCLGASERVSDISFRPKGVGELYAYLPLSKENGDVLEKVPPLSTRNNDYGFSVGRGALDLKLAVGKWIAIAFRVKLNTPGCRDGKCKTYLTLPN